MYINHTVYQGRDNAISIQFRLDQVVQLVSQFTSFVLTAENNAWVVDSITYPTVFDVSTLDRLQIKLGPIVPSVVPLGSYLVSLTTYSPSTPNGVTWPGQLSINVVNPAATVSPPIGIPVTV